MISLKKIELKKRVLFFEFLGWLIAGLILISLIAIATRGFNPAKAPYNPTAITVYLSKINLSDLKIQWYAIFILSGIIAAAFMGTHEFDRFKINRDKLINALLIIVPISIVSSRLYYVIFDPEKSFKTLGQILDIRSGGLSIHGAIIGALISIIVWAKITKTNILIILDVTIIGFLIGQIFGRWGNFMNAEAHGAPMMESPLKNILAPFIKAQMSKTAEFPSQLVHPTFLYELFFNFLALMALVIYRRMRILKIGDTFVFYLIYYGVLRGLLIEPLRTDPLKIGGVNINSYPQMIAFSLIAIAVFVAVRLFYKLKRKASVPYYYDLTTFTGRYNQTKRNLKLVLFDLDGTLLDSKEIIIKSFRTTFKNLLNKEFSDNELLKFIGPSLKVSFTPYANEKVSVDDLINEYTKINKSLHTKEFLKLFPKVKYTLFRLKYLNYQVGLVSSKRREVVMDGLELFGITKYFDTIVCVEDVLTPKPSPEGIIKACNNLGINPKNTIYVGDHVIDIQAAQSAYAKACLVSYASNFEKALNINPDLVIDNVLEIEKYLGKVNSWN